MGTLLTRGIHYCDQSYSRNENNILWIEKILLNKNIRKYKV